MTDPRRRAARSPLEDPDAQTANLNRGRTTVTKSIVRVPPQIHKICAHLLRRVVVHSHCQAIRRVKGTSCTKTRPISTREHLERAVRSVTQEVERYATLRTHESTAAARVVASTFHRSIFRERESASAAPASPFRQIRALTRCLTQIASFPLGKE